jgi:glycosyltransferase involved in cell wall biosynthesis
LISVVHIGSAPIAEDHPEISHLGIVALGQARWVLNLCAAQREFCGIDARIVCPTIGAKKSHDAIINGVPIHYFPVPPFPRGKVLFAWDRFFIPRFIKNINPDLVHAHGTEEANALAALRCPLPHVLTLQGCYFIINKHFRPRFLSRQWIVERLEKRSIPRFRHIITKSDYIRQLVHEEFPHLQTFLIPNTYDPKLECVTIAPEETLKAVAYVGSIDPRKGFDILVDAFELLVRANKREIPTLHVFGDRGTLATSWETRQIFRLKHILGAKLRLHGVLPQMEVAHKVATCSALIAPSREEMFGNQVIEALLVGTHVIVTENTAMAENVRRFGNGTIIPQETPGALANAIKDCIYPTNKPDREYDSIVATNKIHAYMAPKKVAEMHLNLYSQALNEFSLLDDNIANNKLLSNV